MQETNQASPQYFPEGSYPSDSFKFKLKKAWETFQYYARQVWPWIYKLINFIVYNTLKVIKAIVYMGLEQIGIKK
jgi:hypothetical protein